MGTEDHVARGWPESEQVLDWPMANHRAVERAFAGLIARSSTARLLPIHCPSETGKSHITRQLLRNASKLPGLHGGRLDFKGSTHLAGALAEFAENLGVVEPPRAQSCCEQLSHILTSLRARAQPTLLIFDTFEAAGEAERWLREVLLPKLAHPTSSWLRTVVAGQTTTMPHGETWAVCSAEPVRLIAPSAQDWFEYSRERRPDIPLEVVSELHEYAAGKSGLLAQLLGPKS